MRFKGVSSLEKRRGAHGHLRRALWPLSGRLPRHPRARLDGLGGLDPLGPLLFPLGPSPHGPPGRSHCVLHLCNSSIHHGRPEKAQERAIPGRRGHLHFCTLHSRYSIPRGGSNSESPIGVVLEVRAALRGRGVAILSLGVHETVGVCVKSKGKRPHVSCAGRLHGAANHYHSSPKAAALQVLVLDVSERSCRTWWSCGLFFLSVGLGAHFHPFGLKM